jgi:flagellar basal body P-ring formation protein FlgA
MNPRSLVIAATLLAAAAPLALADEDMITPPVLRAQVTVVSDVVRVGDMVENAGSAAQIAIYRSPDLGTTGTLSAAQVISVLQAHQVIGVLTRDVKSVSVTRLARTIESKEIQSQVAHALEHRGGLGEAANLNLTFDREVQNVRLDTSNDGDLQAAAVRYEPRSGRFDVTFEIGNDVNSSRTKLRFTGGVIEMLEAAILTRNVDRGDVLKGSDVMMERRPKAELGGDAAARDQSVGMQMRKAMRAGQPLKTADLGKPDLVQRDEDVTLIYDSGGIYLTVRGKAVESGTEGDSVNVLNLQSKRTVSGVVVGRRQIAIAVPMPRLSAAAETTSSVGNTKNAGIAALADRNDAQVAPKAE